MAKVFGMHMIGLRPGVKGKDFEKFFREKAASLRLPLGWRWSLLKGERGDREGQYLLVVEIESIEARNRFAPAADEMSEEGKQFGESPEVSAVFAEWDKYASTIGAPTIYTDYVVVG